MDDRGKPGDDGGGKAKQLFAIVGIGKSWMRRESRRANFWEEAQMDRSLIEAFGRRVRIGMVGGGSDSVIGRTHLIAMRADGLCDLVAGAISIDPTIAGTSGRQDVPA